MACAKEGATDSAPSGTPAAAFENHFVSDAFWMTLRAIGTGLVPAIQEMEGLYRSIRQLQRDPSAGGGGGGLGGAAQQRLPRYIRYYNCLAGCVYAPSLIRRLLEFYGLVGRWLSSLSPEQAAGVPEHIASDMAFIIDHLDNFIPAQLIGALDTGCEGPFEVALLVMVKLIQRASPLQSPLVKESFAGVLRRLLERESHPQTAAVARLAQSALESVPAVETAAGLMQLYCELGAVTDTNEEGEYNHNRARSTCRILSYPIALRAYGSVFILT